jgi:hypothetical protein
VRFTIADACPTAAKSLMISMGASRDCALNGYSFALDRAHQRRQRFPSAIRDRPRPTTRSHLHHPTLREREAPPPRAVARAQQLGRAHVAARPNEQSKDLALAIPDASHSQNYNADAATVEVGRRRSTPLSASMAEIAMSAAPSGLTMSPSIGLSAQ